MTPLFHPMLINDPFEDPGLFVDFLFSRRAMLFDLGTLEHFPSRKLLRTSHIFVSHTHIDHFIGFTHLIRLCLGRDKHLHLFGPPGFVDQVGHSLAAFTWNLVYNYETDFTLTVSEIHPDGSGRRGEFRCLNGFRIENKIDCHFDQFILHEEENLLVRTAHLDHGISSLGFCLEEKRHINIMKNRLDEMGLAVGPWLKELKAVILRGDSDDMLISSPLREGGGTVVHALGELRERVVAEVAGQKICYVTDAGHTPGNIDKIVDLARGADYLFIETAFLQEETGLAGERNHLTARQAGELARAAGACRVIPFHFSPRYTGREEALREELERAFG